MIGQKKLLQKIDRLVDNGFPRFVMIVGTKGSGKKLLVREIANKLGFPLVPIGISVDEVREVITNSYKNTEPIVYVLPDTDKMSVGAKNALLKITEEPPQKAFFILTVTDTSNTLPTLLSRACVLKMDSYSEEELRHYTTNKHNKLTEEDTEFIIKAANVPEEVDILASYNVKEFAVFVDMVADKLHTVSSANAFKIENKLSLKKDEDKWDVLLFMQALRNILLEYYVTTNDTNYYDSYKCACSTINELKYKNSVNKQYCLDQFILEMRKCWRGE